MKKLFLGLGAMASAFAVVALTSCNGSQKITYTDAEGNQKEVVVKSTSDKDEVAEAVTAIAYSQSEETAKPTSLSFDANFEAKMNGKLGDTKCSVSLDADLKLAIDFGTELKAEDLKTYAEAKVTANAPVAAIFASINNPLALLTADLSKNDKVTVEAKAYGDADYQYFTATKLNGIPFEDMGMDADTASAMVGKYFKMGYDGIMSMTGSSSTSSTKIKSRLSKYLDKYNTSTSLMSLLVGKASQAEFKATIADAVEQYNISISRVNSTDVTFKMTPTKELIGEDYKGDSYIAVSINTLKKVPTAVKFDVADYVAYMMAGYVGESNEVNVSTLKGSVEVKFGETVPTISASDKASAIDFSTIMQK